MSDANVRGDVSWSKTPVRFCKLNVDAALYHQLNKVGIGFVLRNEKGEMM